MVAIFSGRRRSDFCRTAMMSRPARRPLLYCSALNWATLKNKRYRDWLEWTKYGLWKTACIDENKEGSAMSAGAGLDTAMW